MKFVCSEANLVQNINLDNSYNCITAKSKSPFLAIETLANSFAKSKSDCVVFLWNSDNPYQLRNALAEACVENVNFKEIIDDLEKNLDYSILGDFDFETIELENGVTISVAKYVTMNNLKESKKSARKSIEESKIMSYKDFQDVCMEESSENDIINFHEYKGAYFVILRTEEECERLLRVLCKEYGFEGTCYKIIDPYNPNYKCYEIMCV